MSLGGVFNLSKKLNSRRVQTAGRIEPSGFFSVSNVPQKKRDVQFARLSHDETTLLYLRHKDDSPDKAAVADLPSVPNLRKDGQRDSGGPLGSSNAVISHKRAKRGSNGITGRQRRVLKWALASLEKRSPHKTLVFATLTVPTVTPEECAIVQDRWPKIVKNFVQELKRELRRNSLDGVVLGCTEIQSERYRREGLAVPHLHLCYRGRKSARGPWAISYEWIRETFVRVLRNSTGLVFGYSRAVENVQCVKRSVVAYLSKYLSKGFGALATQERANIWNPYDWLILGRNTRAKYIRNTRSGESIGLFLRELLRYPRELWCEFLAPIEIPTAVGTAVVGWYGYAREFFQVCP